MKDEGRMMKGGVALSRNDSVALGSAVVSTAVFGVPPKTSQRWGRAPNGDSSNEKRLAGETPARATGTVALPRPTASSRLGGNLDSSSLSNRNCIRLGDSLLRE